MKPENESAQIPPEKPSGSHATGSDPAAVPTGCETSGSVTSDSRGQTGVNPSGGHTDPGTPESPQSGPRVREGLVAGYPPEGVPVIDFHSPEFNCTDDLNDWSGNYRSFQPLDGIVTANERHQMGRRRHGDTLNPPAGDTVHTTKIEVKRAEEEAVEAAAALTVISKGRTLIIDTDAERAMACGKSLSEAGLLCTVFITKSASTGLSFSGLSRIAFFEVDAVSITGAFGGFSATVTPKGDRKNPVKWFDDAASAFDLVLDLQPTPSFAGDLLPIGYYAPGPGSAPLDEAMAELPEMRGQFKKPQFISFLNSRCLHGRSRARDCRRCLEICPVGAIQPVGGKIVFNHYLCQGCGGCALVCASDAIRVVQPSQEELLNELRSRLEDRAAVGDFQSSLVIYDSELARSDTSKGAGVSGHDHRMHFEVEQIAQVRLEVLLAALAYGAGDVFVACGPQNPPGIVKALESQVQIAHDILRGLGLPEEKIKFAVVPRGGIASEEESIEPAGPGTQTNNPPMTRAKFSPGHDKRTLVRLAAQHLYEKCGARQPWLPLTDGSPFGAVTIDAASCTLCMACASACPSGALSASGEAPRLVFRESQCHQCGLCGESCPEGAIRFLPRLFCDPEAVDARSMLHEAEPFRCVECGEPFASQAMINRIKEKLAGHWMYNDERQLRRLQMCSACRTRDTLTSGDMKSWNPK